MAHWSEQQERANVFWLSILSWSATVLGRGFLRVLCAPIALFFLITAHKPRDASRHYLKKVLMRRVNLWDIYRHFYTFALVSGDRLLFLNGKEDKFELQLEGEEIVQNYSAAGRGCILLVSHLGSFDAMRVPAVETEQIPVRILIDKQHNPAAMQVIEALNPGMAEQAIDASVDSTQLVLSIGEACAAGDMVGIMADRASRGESLQAVDFLGESANFPRGPWLMAMVLKAPVIVCFAVYRGGNRYSVHFREVSDGASVPRKERQARLESATQRYAHELEQMARAHPYNWFNFYDFWLDASTSGH